MTAEESTEILSEKLKSVELWAAGRAGQSTVFRNNREGVLGSPGTSFQSFIPKF